MGARLALALALAAALAPGCAVFEEENRRLLNWMDEGVRPESTAAKSPGIRRPGITSSPLQKV